MTTKRMLRLLHSMRVQVLRFRQHHLCSLTMITISSASEHIHYNTIGIRKASLRPINIGAKLPVVKLLPWSLAKSQPRHPLSTLQGGNSAPLLEHQVHLRPRKMLQPRQRLPQAQGAAAADFSVRWLTVCFLTRGTHVDE